MYLDGLAVNGYRIGPHIGTGASASVFAALNPEGAKVAIKVLPVAKDESAAALFKREVKIGQTIGHSAIVQTLDSFSFGPAQFVVMELVEGVTLKTALGKPLEPRLFFRIFEPLAEGLYAAHCSGVVHRDLKPENVMLANDGTLKILDFGMARLVSDGSVTMTGTFKGTVRYTAPEQIADSKRAGPACDQFALGLMMFEGLTGQPAYKEHANPMMELLDRTQGEPSSLHEVDPRFPQATSDVLARMMATDPGRRFDTVKDAFDAFKTSVAPA